MTEPLLTVVETAPYLAEAKKIMTDEERSELVNMIAADPTCGDLIVGGGGVRKVRFATGNKGKSGGVRVIYYFHNDQYPVFLFIVYAKSDRTNLSSAQLQTVSRLAKTLVESYGD